MKAVDAFVKSKRPAKSKPDMIELLQELYRVMYKRTNSFELNNIGADLAYLMGAIVSDNCCVWPANQPLVAILQENFPPDHAIWNYLAIST